MMMTILKTHPNLFWWQGLSGLFLLGSFVVGVLQTQIQLPTWVPASGFAIALVLWLIGSQSALVLVRRREGVAEFLGVTRIKEGDHPREVYSLGDGVRLMHTSVVLVGILYLLPLVGGLLLSDHAAVLGRYANDAGFRIGSLSVAGTMMICLWLLQLQIISKIEKWYAEVKSLVRLPALSPLDAARVALA